MIKEWYLASLKKPYEAKLTQLLESQQFERHNNKNDSVVLEIDKKLEQRTTRSEQRERDYRWLLSEVDVNWWSTCTTLWTGYRTKMITLLRPVLSLTNSFYEKLNKLLATNFVKFESANKETNAEGARDVYLEYQIRL